MRKFPSRRGRNDYEVGRGRPPKATQFKPGQSGNPKGRPRVQKHLSTILREVLEQKLSIEVGGKMCTITAYQGLFTRALSLGLKGDMRAIKFLAEMASQLPDNTAYTSVNTEGMSAESIQETYFRMIKQVR